MADTVYTFNKTFHQRLDEFKDILCSRESPVLASDVADEWSYSLQTFIEPTGWQALWKISRQICKELQITFPKYVFVRVLQVDFHELTAFVEVESVQDNISIPATQDVPLIQLYPTIKQEETHLNVDLTANLIDQLRFFYNHLWHPWDLEDGEGGDWPSKYLEPRLQLFFEMSNGTIPVKLADKIHKSIEQARKLHEEKQELETFLQKDTATDMDSHGTISPSAEDHTYELMQIHLQLSPLITELQLLENHSMRNLFVKRFLEDETKKQTLANVIIVWQNGFVNDFHDFLTKCKSIIDVKTSTVSASSLLSAVESAVTGSTVLLYKGIHCINQSLEFNMSITGIGSEMPEITGKESHDFLFKARNACIKFKNLKLNLSNVASGLQVLKNSSIELINCVVINGNTQDGRGIVVNPGGCAIIDSCDFSGLHVAVSCCTDSQVVVKDSNFQNCVYGIEAAESSALQISGGVISNCKEAGIFVSQNVETSEKGNVNILKKCKNITESQLQMLNNVNDVLIQSCRN